MTRPLIVAMSLVAQSVCLGGCEQLSSWVPAPLRAGVNPLPSPQVSQRVVGGDSVEGQKILANNTHGCATCHVIPGVPGARGVVGPPLSGFGNRSFIAGTLPNRPGVLIAFVRDAPALVPKTAMPRMDLAEKEARHVAAYLLSLRSTENARE
jgi:cytochrome c